MSVQEPEDVVVGLNDQRRGLREGLVPGQNLRIHVTVGRDDGQPAGLLVQLARDAAHRGIGIEKAVRVEDGAHGSDDRRPARGVLPLPQFHRFLVARDPARRRVDAQPAAGRLSDVAEVAQ